MTKPQKAEFTVPRELLEELLMLRQVGDARIVGASYQVTGDTGVVVFLLVGQRIPDGHVYGAIERQEC